MPQLLVSASTHLIEAPAPDLVLRLIEQHRITSFFAPPTVWISLLRHPDFDKRNLSSPRNVYCGAPIDLPVPVLQELRQRLPGIRAFNCLRPGEIGPLATVLRPEEHDERPASAGRPILNVKRALSIRDARRSARHPGGDHPSIAATAAGLLEQARRDHGGIRGGWFHSGDVGTMDEGGYIFVVDRVKVHHQDRRRRGRGPRGRGGAVQAPRRVGGRRDRATRCEMDRGRDRDCRAAPGHEPDEASSPRMRASTWRRSRSLSNSSSCRPCRATRQASS